MVVLTIETFKTDKIIAISVDNKSSGGSNYKSVKFAYDGGEVPLIHIDGDVTPIFMLPYIIMDLPIFVIAEWATLLVDIRCPRGGS